MPDKSAPEKSTEKTASEDTAGKGGKGGKDAPEARTGLSRLGPAAGLVGLVLWRTTVIVVLSVVTALIAGSAYFIHEASSAPVPGSPADVKQKTPITFYAADGTTVLAILSPTGGIREIVGPEAISDPMKQAIVAAEDRTFFSNPGFAPQRIIQAALGHATGDPNAGGGSSITQQFVKNSLVGDEYSIERKWREILSATQLTARWTKDDVLAAYLNTIYFGRGASGVEKAAQAYYGISARELDLSQSALLAGVVQSPSRWDPAVNPEGAQQRFDYVTEQLVRNEVITEAEKAEMTLPETIEPKTLDASVGITESTGHVVTEALAEAAANGWTRDDLFEIGAQITTTIDTGIQEVISTRARNMADAHGVKVAISSVEPSTGAVRGMWGGDDGLGFNYASSPQMTGSAFKTFTLAAALENGIGLNTPIPSGPYTTGGVTVTNAGGGGCGSCSMAEATKQSLNTSFYRIQDMLPNRGATTRDMAHRLGVNAPLAEEDGHTNLAITLGAYGTSTLQMASGYATLANGGVRHDRHFIETIRTRNSQAVYVVDTHPHQAVAASVARDVSTALEPVAAYSGGRQLSDKTGYMKTGTTQLGDTGANRDAYVAGYTPRMSTAVWVGTDDGRPLVNAYGAQVWGAGLPSELWQATMNIIG